MANIPLIVFLAAFSVIQRISGDVSYKWNRELKAGQNARIYFTTKYENPILGVQFGLKGEGEKLKTKFISVTQFHGTVCGEDFNSTEGWRYRNRVFFVGNITAGRAWFMITNVDENDTNIYQAGIREINDTKYKFYTVELLVKKKKEISSPTTTSVITKVTKTQPNGTTVNIMTAPIEVTVKIIAAPIEVNREPPYHFLIIANVIAFAYAMYTLYVKPRVSQNHCLKTRSCPI